MTPKPYRNTRAWLTWPWLSTPIKPPGPRHCPAGPIAWDSQDMGRYGIMMG